MAASDVSISEVYEQLQLDFEEESNRYAELQQEVRSVEIEAKALRLRLQAESIKNGRRPTAMPSCSVEDHKAEMRAEELRRLLHWLAERIDLSTPPAVYDVGFEVSVGGRAIRLDTVAQWTLRSLPTEPASVSGPLRFAVPAALQGEITALLTEAQEQAQSCGRTARRLTETWDLIAGDVATAQLSRPEPAVLLANKQHPQGILVATWPTPEAMEAFRAQARILQQTVPTEKQIAPRAIGADVPAVGDRVEVEYDGEWYTGRLVLVDPGNLASVQCDVDPAGILTRAHITCVRRLAPDGSRPSDSGSGRSPLVHKRSKSTI